jgi:hypothetical protein
MAQWMGKVGFELQPLADYVLERIKQGERIFADETTLSRVICRALIALTVRVERRQLRIYFCAFSAFARFHTAWTHLRHRPRTPHLPSPTPFQCSSG